MKRVIFVLLGLLLGACWACQSPEKPKAGQEKTPNSQEDRPPNIVFIFADDLGYGDLSSFGHDSIATPHLDSLAAGGLRMTRFYANAPVCTPSRAAFVTGQYPVRTGMNPVMFPNSVGGLDSATLSIADLLKNRGYRTGLIGKWHLGHKPQYMPNAHGFDYYFGLPYSNDMEWEPRRDPPLPLYENQTLIASGVDQRTLTQRYTTEAQNFILRNRQRPFFLFFPHTFPHKPWHRSARFKGASDYGLYGDVIEELDWSVGEVVRTLRQEKLLENTLIVFSSDNGAIPKVSPKSNGGLRGWKSSTYEGGIRVPMIAHWPGQIPAGTVSEETGAMFDLYPTFAEAARAEIPDTKTLDGISLLPNLKSPTDSLQHPPIYFYFEDRLETVIDGAWKYKRPYNNQDKRKLADYPQQLFHLEKDPRERNNLAEEKPAKARELESQMQAFEASLTDVRPPQDSTIPFPDPRQERERRILPTYPGELSH